MKSLIASNFRNKTIENRIEETISSIKVRFRLITEAIKWWVFAGTW